MAMLIMKVEKSFLVAAFTSRAMKAEKALEEATNALHIARARGQGRFARMDLERRRPSIYGQQTKHIVEPGGDLVEALRAVRQRVLAAQKEREAKDAAIEGEAEVVSDGREA